MQTEHVGDLIALLLESAKRQKLVPSALQTVSPFFERARNGYYPLAAAAEFDPIETGRVLKSTVGKGVTRLTALSSNELAASAKEGGTPRLWFFGTSLADKLMERNSAALADRLGMLLTDRLFRCLHSGLLDRLNDAIAGSCGRQLDYCVLSKMQSSVGEALYFYLGFAMAGDRRRMAVLEPLLALLRRTIPLGHERDQPGNWTTMVA